MKLAVALAVLVAFHQNVSASEVLVQKQSFPLPSEALHAAHKANPTEDTYQHTRVLFEAVRAGQSTFSHVEKKTEFAGDVGDYKNVVSQAFHTTTTTGTLFPDKKYLSLDDEKVFSGVAAMGDSSVIFCASSVSAGDYIIGTSEGKWFSQYGAHANHGSKTGFVFAREVESTTPVTMNGRQCHNVITSVVHPLQIVQHTEIRSEIQFPFSVNSVPGTAGESKAAFKKSFAAERKLGAVAKAAVAVKDKATAAVQAAKEAGTSGFFGTPDEPLLLCDDEEMTDKLGTLSKTGSGTVPGYSNLPWSYALDLNGNECVAIEAKVPGSYNFNWARGTEAVKKLPIGPSNLGITCTNCYAFLGASILAVANIFGGKLSTFAFEVKRTGGAGFSLELEIKNPSVQASKYFNLMAASSARTTIPLAYGIALKVGFGGAWATVSGTGSIEGSGSFGTGYTLAVEDSITYGKANGWTNRQKITDSDNLDPEYSYEGLKLGKASYRASVVAALSTRIVFELGGYIGKYGIAASFSTVMTATGQFTYFKSGSTPPSMKIAASYDNGARALASSLQTKNFWDGLFGNSRSQQQQQQLSSPANTYYTGDQMHFDVDYANMNPNEDHTMFLSLHRDGDESQGYPIAAQNFRTSSTGFGKVRVAWEIPHNTNFDQNTQAARWHASVHCSGHNFDRWHSQRFHIKHSRRNEHMPGPETFGYPRDGSIVSAGEKTKMRWNRHSLHSFKAIPGTDGMGQETESSRVTIIIVAEDENGLRTAWELASNVPNTGEMDVVFPAFLRSQGRRFFAVMHDALEYSLMAWGSGYFQINPPISQQPAQMPVPVPLPPVSLPPAATDPAPMPPMEPGPVVMPPSPAVPMPCLNATSVPPPVVDNLPLWVDANPAGPAVPTTATDESATSSTDASASSALAAPGSVSGSGNLRSLQFKTSCPYVLSIKLEVQLGFDGLNFLGKMYPINNAATPPFTLVPQTNYDLCP